MELRPILETDRQVFLDILTHEAVKATYMLPDFETREAAGPLFLRLVKLSREDGRFVRAICKEGRVVGFLNDVEIQNGSIELGYVIHPDHWGRGYATDALKLALGELFALGYREVRAGAFAENTASLRVMEKAGMEKLAETEEIEYRGKVHACIYFRSTAPCK